MAERDDPKIGGGMTGETGNLTAGEDEPFVPAELREIGDPRLRDAVTLGQRDRSDVRRVGEPGDEGPPDTESSEVAGTAAAVSPTELAQHSSGYGSGHGLAEDDPAYRMEVNRPASREPASPPAPAAADELDTPGDQETRRGVDEFGSEEEHL